MNDDTPIAAPPRTAALNELYQSDPAPILVVGAHSAARRRLVEQWRGCSPTPLPITIAVDVMSTGSGIDTPLLLYRVLSGLRQSFGFHEPVPIVSSGMEELLPNWLARASAAGGLLLILHDLDRLDDDPMGALPWLPAYLPSGVRLLATASPGLCAGELQRRGWQQLGLTMHGAEQSTESPTEVQVLTDVEDGLPPDIARRLLCGLWAARQGLSVSTLRALASDDEEVVNALLELAAPLLQGIGHRYYLRDTEVYDAVRHRYLRGTEARLEAYRSLTRCSPEEAGLYAAAGRDRPSALAWLNEPGRLESLRGELRFLAHRICDALVDNDDALREHLLSHDTDERSCADSLARAQFLMERGEDDACEALLRHARRRAESELEAARADTMLGRWLSDRGQWQEAQQRLHDALLVHEEQLGRSHDDTLASLHVLANLAEVRHDLESATALYQDALSRRQETLTERDPRLMPYLGNLAAALKAANRLEEAEPYAQHALRLAEEALGPTHPSTISAMDALASIRYAGHDYPAAMDGYRRAARAAELAFGPESAATAACYHNLATALDAAEHYEEAELWFRRALTVRQRELGTDHQETASSLHNLAGVLDVTGRREEAERLYRQAIATWERIAGAVHPATATSINNLADLLRESGRVEEAESLYRRNFSTWTELYGAEHPNTLMTAAELGRLYVDMGRHNQGEGLLRETVNTMEAVLGPLHPLRIEALCAYATLLRSGGRQAEARRLLEQTEELALGSTAILRPVMQKLRRHLDALRRGSD